MNQQQNHRLKYFTHQIFAIDSAMFYTHTIKLHGCFSAYAINHDRETIKLIDLTMIKMDLNAQIV